LNDFNWCLSYLKSLVCGVAFSFFPLWHCRLYRWILLCLFLLFFHIDILAFCSTIFNDRSQCFVFSARNWWLKWRYQPSYSCPSLQSSGCHLFQHSQSISFLIILKDILQRNVALLKNTFGSDVVVAFICFYRYTGVGPAVFTHWSLKIEQTRYFHGVLQIRWKF